MRYATYRLARGLRAGGTLLPLLVALTAAASVNRAESAQLEILKAFDGGIDGGGPSAGVIAGPDGTLYGTTTSGGSANCSGGCGTIFQLAPPGPSQSKWKHTVLYRFTAGTDGFWPISGLLLDAAGALYGTSTAGVGNLWGNVFKLTPPASAASRAPSWTFSILNDLAGGTRGSNPLGAVLRDPDGNLYASASMGGANDHGTVFRVAPPQPGSHQWKAAAILSFAGSDGDFPTSTLIFGLDGSIYGTTRLGGDSNLGTVFRLTPPEPGNKRWKRTVLHHFASGAGGLQPEAGVVMDGAGSLYGTTQGGGVGGGTLFMLSPPQPGKHVWKYTVLFSFPSDDHGAGKRPLADLMIGPGGTIFGTTDQGGSAVFGTVFKLTPPAADRAAQWTHTVLHNFASGADGSGPGESGVVFGLGGALYGTTHGGAGTGFGAVYKLVP